jgi:GNAT superfamily N-acetyltransferase
VPEVVFAWEPFSGVIREARPLLERHWQEIALNKERVPLDPDWDTYFELERVGALHVLAARADGLLVGYASVIVRPLLHYRSTLGAETDIFWLAPEYREGWTGVRLFREVLRGMKRLGVKRTDITPKLHYEEDRGGVSKILTALGGRPIETRFSFWTGD